MGIQLKVVKADGSVEEYLHTKVIGSISNAIAAVGQADVLVAEELADVITYHLYHKQNLRSITTSEVLSMIEVVLAATGYEDAAVAISEHHFERKLKRSRIEVTSVDIQGLADADMLCQSEESVSTCRWDKSRIVNHLVVKHGVSLQTARMIASMVEEKIFNMGITQVPAGLIKQLVLNDAAVMLRAQRQLQVV